MEKTIMKLIKERVVLLDGGMGTELMKYGLGQGQCPELWNIDKREIVKKIHHSYYEAGSDAVLTNSFGGSAIKLSSFGLEGKCFKLNYEAAVLANEVKPKDKFLAGSIGPTGKFLKPQGEFTEKEFEEAFEEQARGLTEGKVDFLLIETQYDLREALCALRGAKRISNLPIFVTMTFNKSPRGYFNLMGNSVSQCVKELEDQGVPVLGTNCTLKSDEMADLIGIMRKATRLPLIAQANAGQPEMGADGKVTYAQDVEDYVRYIPQMIDNGVNVIGGCCGTNPEYIRRMAEVLKEREQALC